MTPVVFPRVPGAGLGRVPGARRFRVPGPVSQALLCCLEGLLESVALVFCLDTDLRQLVLEEAAVCGFTRECLLELRLPLGGFSGRRLTLRRGLLDDPVERGNRFDFFAFRNLDGGRRLRQPRIRRSSSRGPTATRQPGSISSSPAMAMRKAPCSPIRRYRWTT